MDNILNKHDSQMLTTAMMRITEEADMWSHKVYIKVDGVKIGYITENYNFSGVGSFSAYIETPVAINWVGGGKDRYATIQMLVKAAGK